MSTAAFWEVSQRLKTVLEKALDDDPNVDGSPKVALADPTDQAGGEANRVSVWLYQVAFDEFARNVPTPIVEGNNGSRRLRFPPLGVNLHYLITPMLGSAEKDQQAFARIMLTLYEQALLVLDKPEIEVKEQIRISYVPDALDERIKLWDSLKLSYRLSGCWLVRTVRLASKDVTSDTPITTTTTGLAEIPKPRLEGN